ncbi:OLC1v1014459C1 [Oldenlandia corymbosa var. corymbosa]|nr:OLC1v1014459C1 [Oldenlandia corymbosa var. corymbosa]
MGVLCFVLDLRSLAPSLLRELKQSLLQLANYYAIYNPLSNHSSRTQSEALPDRIGLCYILTNRMTCSTELKVAYTPRGNFNLRDFHHAVNHLPADAFIPEFNSSGAISFADFKISSVLSDEVLYSWGKCDNGVTRKLFLISSCVVRILDWDMKKILKDAADKCVSVEFTYIECNMNHSGDTTENINNFVKQIGDLENCSFRSYLPDPHVFSGMVKQWFQELKDDMEELLQTRFCFKYNLINNVNQLSCNLYRCFYEILDGFVSCKTCRCHGIPMDEGNVNKKKISCPVTGRVLGELDLIENSLKIGESTILLMPSFQCCQKLEQVSFPIDFTVVERTPIGSLSEGAIFGPSYVVAASTYDEYDDTDKWERNSQLFQVVCEILSSLDQGLICSSYCNVQTMEETSFLCYYVLLPSDKGMMLLRRLVASEEILPLFCGNQFTCSKMAKEMENVVHSSLLKMEARTYNPLQHERGFHQKLNLLVKESLQFG